MTLVQSIYWVVIISHGMLDLQQDQEKAIELWNQAAELGSSHAHHFFGNMNDEGGDFKKTKFHYGAAAMAGHQTARSSLGYMEIKSGNTERAVKHFIIAASAGSYLAMRDLLVALNQGLV